MSKRAAIYVHSATIDRYSLRIQETACRALAGNSVGGIVSVVAETDPAQRTTLEQLLHECEAGQIGAIIVHRLDRLSRNLSKLLVLMDRLETMAIELRSVSEPSLLGPVDLRRYVEWTAELVEQVSSIKAR